MARNKNAKRNRSTFRKSGGNGWNVGAMNNRCGCIACRGHRFLF